MDAFNQSPKPEGYPKPYQQRILWHAITIVSIAVVIFVATFIFEDLIKLLSWSYPILLPIGLAVIIALVLDPFVNLFQKRGMGRGNATLLVCILSVIAFLLFWVFLGQALVAQTSDFFKTLPSKIDTGFTKLQAALPSPKFERTEPPPPEFAPKVETSELPTPKLVYHMDTNAPPAQPETSTAKPPQAGAKDAGIRWLADNLPAIQASIQKNLVNMVYEALGPVGQAFGFILGFGFVPIYVYYFLADQDQISKHWHDYVPMRRSPLRDEIVSVLLEINTSLVSYFRGQIIVAGCNGALTFLGLWAIGVPYSLILGIITGALSIVPFLGIIASIIPALLLGFLSAPSGTNWQWITPLMVIGVFAIVQMSESMFITPRVQSHSTGLHPLAIILGILFWSLLLPGLLGPIVAVPLTCALVVVLRRYVWQEKTEAAPATDQSSPAT